MKKRINKGFTLLEILLVIAAIGILASIVIVAINPLRQISKAENASRWSNINTIQKALDQYYIANGKYPDSVPSGSYEEICDTGGETLGDPNPTDCTDKIDLRVLVPQYIAEIPKDPNGGGYKVGINLTNNSVGIWADKAKLGEYIAINRENVINEISYLQYSFGETVPIISAKVFDNKIYFLNDFDLGLTVYNGAFGNNTSKGVYYTNYIDGATGGITGKGSASNRYFDQLIFPEGDQSHLYFLGSSIIGYTTLADISGNNTGWGAGGWGGEVYNVEYPDILDAYFHKKILVEGDSINGDVNYLVTSVDDSLGYNFIITKFNQFTKNVNWSQQIQVSFSGYYTTDMRVGDIKLNNGNLFISLGGNIMSIDASDGSINWLKNFAGYNAESPYDSVGPYDAFIEKIAFDNQGNLFVGGEIIMPGRDNSMAYISKYNSSTGVVIETKSFNTSGAISGEADNFLSLDIVDDFVYASVLKGGIPIYPIFGKYTINLDKVYLNSLQGEVNNVLTTDLFIDPNNIKNKLFISNNGTNDMVNTFDETTFSEYISGFRVNIESELSQGNYVYLEGSPTTTVTSLTNINFPVY